jgi:cysteine desulfuration protein SufE
MSITDKKDRILKVLSEIQDTDSRYRFIIAKGKALPELTEAQKLDKFLITGCLSKAWLVPELLDGKVLFRADSEAAIVKGIMAILVEVYSGNSPKEILSLSPEFLKEGGISEHLSLNRRNGLSSFVKQIMLYASVYLRLES